MKQPHIYLLCILVLITGFFPQPTTSNSQSFENRVDLVNLSDSGVELIFSTPDIYLTPDRDTQFSQSRLIETSLDSVFSDDYAISLPYITATIQVPADCEALFEVKNESSESFTGIVLPKQKLIDNPASIIFPDDGFDGNYSVDGSSNTTFVDLIGENGVIPGNYWSVKHYWIRNQHLAQVTFFPAQYDSIRELVTIRDYLHIKVVFQKNLQQHNVIEGSWFEPSGQYLGNRTVSKPGWLGIPTDEIAQTYADAIRYSGQPRVKVAINHDGIYKISHSDLINSGLDITNIDPHYFSLSNQGRPVSIIVTGEDDNSFDPSDLILFYGEALRGDYLAQRYQDEDIGWLTYRDGWTPQVNADFIEKYTQTNVYWLSISDTPGQRMLEEDHYPDQNWPIATNYEYTQHAEVQYSWWSYHFTGEDNWFDRNVNSTTRGLYYPIEISAIADEDFSPIVRGEVVPFDNNAANPNDHHTLASLNYDSERAATIEDTYWDGPSRHEFIGQIPKYALLDGTNQLYFRLMEDSLSTRIYFDWFEITYLRKYLDIDNHLPFTDHIGNWGYYLQGFPIGETIHVLDVTNSTEPMIISNLLIDNGTARFERASDIVHSYFSSSQSGLKDPVSITLYNPPDLLSPSNGADYIIIAHQDFIDSANVLAAFRQSQGYRTKVIDFTDIVNEFGDGIYHPVAIKNFLRYAFLNWQSPPPSFVVLVGDGNFNLVNSINPGFPPATIFLPPNLGFIDSKQGEVDDTNALASVVGRDILPDLIVSRIPVNTIAEFDSVINRTILYETGLYTDPWRTRALLIADNVPDDAGDFVGISNALIDDYLLPADFVGDTVYLNDYSGNGANARAAIVQKLNTTGASIVSYVGHGYVNRWAGEGIFYTDTIASLTNNNQLPVVLSMTCLDGSWYLTGNYPNSIAEVMIRSQMPTGEPRGAVAMLASTGFGTVADHDVLERGALDAILNRQAPLGQAILEGKLDLFFTGTGKDVIQSFTLFGDPALKVVETTLELPEPPGNVQATDGYFTDRIQITWEPGARSEYYQIYRGLLADGSDRSLVGYSNNKFYEDQSVLANVDYIYWVSAVNRVGEGELSQPDSGYRSNVSLPPDNVQASDGYYLLKIAITWNPSNGADTYSVYRKLADETGDPVLIAETSETYFEDFNVDELLIYEYSIKAVNGFGESSFSASDTGYRASTSSLPGIPMNLDASDGTYPDQVLIVWNAVDNADSYNIFRKIFGSSDDPELVGISTSASYQDFGVLPGIVYQYQVSSENIYGESGLSLPDAGSLLVPPGTPSGVAASDGTHIGKIIITWNTVESADYYEVYRSLDDLPIGTSESSMYIDMNVVPGQVYYYWVKAINLAGSSAFSISDDGFAPIPIFLPIIIR